MLASRYRLKQARDISRVFQRGRYVGGAQISLKALQTHRPETRAVVVVSKKVSKKAVVRNRLRRRVSGVLEEQWQTVAPGYDIVITVRQDLQDMGATELKKLLIAALTKSGVLPK